MFRASAHSPRPCTGGGSASPRVQLPMCSRFLTPSRRCKRVLAASRSSPSINAQRDRIGRAEATTTNVIRPSCDCRANSTGTSGPSSNQPRRMGNPRGSQIREPQPRHAILVTFQLPTLHLQSSRASSTPLLSSLLSSSRAHQLGVRPRRPRLRHRADKHLRPLSFGSKSLNQPFSYPPQIPLLTPSIVPALLYQV